MPHARIGKELPTRMLCVWLEKNPLQHARAVPLQSIKQRTACSFAAQATCAVSHIRVDIGLAVDATQGKCCTCQATSKIYVYMTMLTLSYHVQRRPWQQ
jgi:hypothetical protein